MICCLFHDAVSTSENSVEGRMTRELWVKGSGPDPVEVTFRHLPTRDEKTTRISSQDNRRSNRDSNLASLGYKPELYPDTRRSWEYIIKNHVKEKWWVTWTELTWFRIGTVGKRERNFWFRKIRGWNTINSWRRALFHGVCWFVSCLVS